MRIVLFRLALQYAAKQPSPDRIPLSGEKRLNERKYYSIHLSENSRVKSYLVSSADRSGVQAKEFDGTSYSMPVKLNWKEASKLKPQIVQYYKRGEFRYYSSAWFLLAQFLRIAQLKIFLDGTAQSLYNRKKLIRAERLEILRALVERALESDRNLDSPLTLLRSINTHRMARHPDLNRSLAHMRLHLASLVDSKDAINSGGLYSASPQAVTTLSQIENEERRHVDLRRLQFLAVGFAGLTALGVIFKTEQIQQFPMAVWDGFCRFVIALF